MFKKIKHIHFVGIGGVGMSGIAEVLLNLGYIVSGSDLKLSETTQHLQSLGAKIFEGHRPQHTEGADVVVRSSAVATDNPEIQRAKEKLVPVIPRAEMLAELMRLKYGVAVAGTHGKTTTTSMVAQVLARGGLDPTIVIGGRVNSLGTNAKLGNGEFLVAEADESDGSFLKLSPTIAVVTTIDAEHLDYYQDLEDIKHAFLQFINKVPFYGAAIMCLDQENIQSLVPWIEKRFISYGLHSQADITAKRCQMAAMGSSCQVFYQNNPLGILNLKVPGIHNVCNALAAVAVGLELDISWEKIKEALEEFSGVGRRFQVKGNIKDIMVIDDYGHHPVEIKATLQAAKDGWGRRVIAIFQPHRYTRVQALLEDFFTAFYQADYLFITDIYSAGEKPIEGVSARQIAEGVKKYGHHHVTYIPQKEEILSRLLKLVQPGDLVITMGAGDIWKTGEELVKLLEKKYL